MCVVCACVSYVRVSMCVDVYVCVWVCVYVDVELAYLLVWDWYPSKGLVVLGSNKTLGPQCWPECLHTVHGTLG